MGHKTLLANVYNKIPGTIILEFYLAVDFMEILSSSRSNYSYYSILMPYTIHSFSLTCSINRAFLVMLDSFLILDKCEP